MQLTAEHFPFTCTLQARVMQHFADRFSPIDADPAMDAEELRTYLRNMDYDSFYPTGGVLAQTEAIGDPAPGSIS
tara:strand:- start:19979 stop:20203 length:225 start_codon:yes stop_codon:yes gene_type:complete